MEIGTKYGCLEVINDDSEYIISINTKISDISDEKNIFIKLIEEGNLKRDDWYGWNGEREVITPAYIYKPRHFSTYHKSVRERDFDEAIEELVRRKQTKRYKCKCRKCGKIRFYTLDTLQTNPQYCLRPMYCSEKFTYSVKSANATYRRKQKYKNDESVKLVGNKYDVIPQEEYCDKWNEKRNKELRKQSEKDAAIIASIPRKHAANYDCDYAGMVYESLEIEECVNENLESTPTPYYNQRHQKKYRDIIVYKKYRCRCYLCGKEQMINCDKFGIFPPTEYGYRAYGGYWSAVSCDCHPISSFQWIVNDLLIKNNVPYRVEYSFDDLYGISNVNNLRYDFAVFNADGSLKALVECQGEQHYQAVDEFGGESQFQKQKANDELKKIYAKDHKIKLIEISYKDKKYESIEVILKKNGILPNKSKRSIVDA